MAKKILHTLMILALVMGLFVATTAVYADRDTHTHLKGVIAAIDTTAGTLTVTPAKGGADVIITVTPTTRIKRQGKPATLADLQVGDRVEIKYNPATGVAEKIEAKMNVVKVRGVIAAVDTTASTVTITPALGGADITLLVDANTMIKRFGLPATLADLVVGDNVQADYNPITLLAYRIEVKPAELKGTIAAVDTTAGTLTVTPQAGGADVTFTVTSTTVIKRYGVLVTLADLQVGDFVEVKYDPATMVAFKIEVKPAELKGTIAAVDTTASTLTVTPLGGGTDMTFNVDTTTVIRRRGQVLTLANLVVRQLVEVKYDPLTMHALRIEVK
ncbi:MAG: DUF5666 domain-containing protein [Anaerolineae bacterium]